MTRRSQPTLAVLDKAICKWPIETQSFPVDRLSSNHSSSSEVAPNPTFRSASTPFQSRRNAVGLSWEPLGQSDSFIGRPHVSRHRVYGTSRLKSGGNLQKGWRRFTRKAKEGLLALHLSMVVILGFACPSPRFVCVKQDQAHRRSLRPCGPVQNCSSLPIAAHRDGRRHIISHHQS